VGSQNGSSVDNAVVGARLGSELLGHRGE
jgi:hypothetical protein